MSFLKFNMVTESINNRFLAFGVQISLGLFLIAHFDSDRSDFRLFYNSAQELKSGISPWNVNIHEYGNAYLNDPITLWFLTPLTFTSYEVALLIFRIINVAIAIIMLNILVKGNSLKIMLVSSAFFLTTVTMRANLEYGALGFLAFAIWLTAVNLIRNNEHIILAGVLLAYTSMFKPQLYFINVVFLIVGSRKLKLSFVATIAVAIGGTSLAIQKFMLIDWIEAIILRAEIAQSDNLQMDFACLLRILGVEPLVATAAYVLLVILISLIILRAQQINTLLRRPVTMLMLATTFSIFLHPTDLSVAAFVVLTMFLLKGEITLFGLFAVSLLSVWSNDLAFSMISGLILLSLFWVLSAKHSGWKMVFATFVSGIPSVFALIAANMPTTENFLRNASNYLGLCLLMAILLSKLIASGAEEKRRDKNQLRFQ
jgi:hypothetical protein